MLRFVLCAVLAVVLSPAVTAQNGAVINQTFAYGPGAVHTILIAVLPPATGSQSYVDYDHIHILTTLNTGDAGWQNSFVDAAFGNRNGFTYSWFLRGTYRSTATQSKLVAYQNSDTSVSLYMVLGDQYVQGGYSVLEAEDEWINQDPTDLGASTPSGTLVFDTSNSVAYPPASFFDFSGNMTVQGNLALPGTGTSVTFSDNTVQSTAWNGTTLGGDYAEAVDVLGDRAKYEPGDVIVIDAAAPGSFGKSDKAYSRLVAGVFSTKPGLVGRRTTAERPDKNAEVPMAMMGIVPTKVSTENGAIEPGDLLVSSSSPGYAMKGTDASRLTGAIIGKALASLKTGSGVIEVLVSLQ